MNNEKKKTLHTDLSSKIGVYNSARSSKDIQPPLRIDRLLFLATDSCSHRRVEDVGLSTSNIVPKKNGNETKDMLLLELGPIALEVARRKPGETPSNSS